MKFKRLFEKSFNKSLKRYNRKKVIDLKKELEDEYINILNRLDIFVKDCKYTGCEFEKLMIEIGSYSGDDEMTEIELELELEGYKSLEKTDVSQEEYIKLNNKIDSILNKYKSVFIL